MELMERAGRTLLPEQAEQFERYLALLLEANQKMNLTRIDDLAAARVQHIGDALTLLPWLPEKGRIADVGSGGGVPGLVLAISRPDMSFTLIEATLKKAEFLGRAARELGLPNVAILPQRAEGVAREGRRFHVVTARAVAPLDRLLEWCLPLLRPDGVLLAMKGARAQEEIRAARPALAGRFAARASVHPVKLPGLDHHQIVVIGGKNDRAVR